MKSKKLWFKAKHYGWGWYPVTWQGGVIIAVYAGLIAFFFSKADATSHSGSDTLIKFAIPFIVTTSALSFICYKTGEKPKWRWGGKN